MKSTKAGEGLLPKISIGGIPKGVIAEGQIGVFTKGANTEGEAKGKEAIQAVGRVISAEKETTKRNEKAESLDKLYQKREKTDNSSLSSIPRENLPEKIPRMIISE